MGRDEIGRGWCGVDGAGSRWGRQYYCLPHLVPVVAYRRLRASQRARLPGGPRQRCAARQEGAAGRVAGLSGTANAPEERRAWWQRTGGWRAVPQGSG